MPYKHLSLEERTCIAVSLNMDCSLREIARVMKRSVSTISRELKRNSSPVEASYSPAPAQQRARKRSRWKRKRPKSEAPHLLKAVEESISAGWSPEQIAGRLQLGHPKEEQWQVSHQTIYAMVAKQPKLCKLLRRAGKKIKKRYGTGSDARGHLKDCKPISKRPAVVDKRKRFGDWEGDSMRGGKGRVVVLGFVERKTGFFKASRHLNNTADSMFRAAKKAFSDLPDSLLRTLTLDNGKENACHPEIKSQLGLEVYFADPGCAWQKGTCENTLGLLRQYVPKKKNIANVKAKQLRRYVDSLNNRPRKRLGYRTPKEAFVKAIRCT
jgi:transposase, IS30 family